MELTHEQAQQIAKLLNTRNQLQIKYSADQILQKAEEIVFLTDGEIVTACAEAKRVQWYQYEILHVSTHQDHEGKGNASRVLRLAEQSAINRGARVLQCTIRSDNEDSIRLFERNSYNKTASFFNKRSGNWVNVYQKMVSTDS